MPENKWSESEVKEMQALDREVAQLVSNYLGGPLKTERLFVPTRENLAELNGNIDRLLSRVGSAKDPFWRAHFTAALESLSFQVRSNTNMPYEFVTRLSSRLDRLTVKTTGKSADEAALEVADMLKNIAFVVQAVGDLAAFGTDLAKSQLADVLPALLGNIERSMEFINQNAVRESLKSDGETLGRKAMGVTNQVQSTVKQVPVGSMSPVDIPFSVSVEEGMQAPLDYVLSWYEEDAVSRNEEYLRIAEKTFPGQDPSEVLGAGGSYNSIEALFADMRRILDRLQHECKRFVDLPEGEHCDIGLIPETWRMMVPGFMYMGGFVAINPDNLGSYRKVGLETTAVHEVYPGHHVNSVKSAQHALPYTFNLGLFWSRCLQEGMCDRSMVMMTPYFEDPAAGLSVASRLRFTANRVKAEVDIYHNKKPVQAVIDNYMNNLGLPRYNAEAQTRAHLMRPADAISYYTGMKFLDDLSKESDLDQKVFTNEIFSYGSIPLATMKSILGLSAEKKKQIKSFTS